MGILAMILAGGKGERLHPLILHRAKPAVPFGGLYRIVDFTLSNCINSNYENGGPAMGAFHITPSNSADVTHTTRGIYVGGAGNAKVTMYSGEIVTLTGLLAGNYYPLCVTRVWAADTTATLLIGLY